jgi:hypothetical protein
MLVFYQNIKRKILWYNKLLPKERNIIVVMKSNRYKVLGYFVKMKKIICHISQRILINFVRIIL